MTDSLLAAIPASVAAILDSVKDPEVPVLSVVELGVVRAAEVHGDRITVTITPTYSGCPALDVMEREIRQALTAAGYAEVSVKTVYAPAWTTDWIPPAAREKLRVYGIAPPGPVGTQPLIPLSPTVRTASTVPCPYCGSANTTTESEFGPTACKSLHVCHSCRQPFEHFKAF
jgi:ring-1,2-phenylacetyl-CoA epoxidase subunit PaaD